MADTLAQLLESAGHSRRCVRFLDSRETAIELPYAELAARAARAASAYGALGLEPGARVALILPTAPSFYDAFFGAVLARLTPVPLYPPVRLGRLDEYHARTAEMLRACRASLVVSDAAIRRWLGRSLAAAGLASRCVDAAELLDAPAAIPVMAAVRADDLAFIQFSSGTTGSPKPIALTHRAVLANTAAIRARLLADFPEQDGLEHRVVSWLPLYHDMGLVGCLLSAMGHSAELTLIPPELFVARPALWLRAMSRYRATISAAPSFAYGLCAAKAQEAELEGVDLSEWRVALNGAEPIAAAPVERFIERFARFGLRPEVLTPVYGLGEATLAVTFSPPRRRMRWRHVEPDSEERVVSVGAPLEGIALRVVDAEGAELPDGKVGRVLVRGPSLMRGYDGAPEATRAVLQGGWLDTGDLGFLDGGELFICGRVKDVIIVRGRKHAPHRIEGCLEGVAGVRAGCAAAFGVLGDGGEALVVLFERARGALHDDAVVEVRRRIVEDAGIVPADVQALAPGTLPRTSSGKIRRGEARRRYLAGDLGPPAPVTALRLGVELVRSWWHAGRGL